MTAAAIRIEGLRFAYPGGRQILDIGRLEVPRGRRVFLHGPSGSGKTTLLGLVAGILEGHEGMVEVLGKDMNALSGRQKDAFRGSHMGYIFQMFNLIPYLDVQENIALPCRMSAARRERLGRLGVEEKARELAGHLGIGHVIRSKVTNLSVGQQQRVAAARALMGAPELIIADEPTSALDHDHRQNFLELLFAEAELTGSTVLFVSHDHSLKGLFEEVISLRDLNRARTEGGVA